MPAKRKDETVITALLTNSTIKDAATACGLSESRIYSRLKEPEFKSKYDKARRELLEQSSYKLQSYLSLAIDEMKSIFTNKDNPPQVRLNAAEAIVRTSLKLTEQVDIIKRIEQLEETQRAEKELYEDIYKNG